MENADRPERRQSNRNGGAPGNRFSGSSLANQEREELRLQQEQSSMQIAELRDQIRQLAEILANQTAQQPQPPAMHLPQYAPTQPIISKLPKLRDFDGQSESLEIWLTQVRDKIATDLTHLSDIEKFYYVSNCLKGKAAEQMLGWLNEKNQSGTGSYAGLIRQLEATFLDHNRVNKASRALRVLTQGKRTFQDYLTEFRVLLTDAQGLAWPLVIQSDLLYAGLNHKLKVALVSMPAITSSLENYIAQIGQVADRLEALDHKPWLTKSIYMGNKDQGHPIDIDSPPLSAQVASSRQTRAQWVPKTEIERRRANRLCLRCGQSGHLISACRMAPAIRPTLAQPSALSAQAATTAPSEPIGREDQALN